MKELKRYYIDTLTSGKHVLVKVLNEYNTKDKAVDDLLKLTTRKTREKELLKEYSKKNILE